MMLEIINSCFTNSLHHNPNLVYALLYKRDLFEQFRTHPSFQDIMQNIDLVSSYEFSMVLQSNVAGKQIPAAGALSLMEDTVSRGDGSVFCWWHLSSVRMTIHLGYCSCINCRCNKQGVGLDNLSSLVLYDQHTDL